MTFIGFEWIILLSLTVIANLSIIGINILRANLVDEKIIHIKDLAKPLFYLKSLEFYLIIIATMVWFFSLIYASFLASKISSKTQTATLVAIFYSLSASVFGLLQYYIIYIVRKEKISNEMWKWIILAAVSIGISTIMITIALN